MTRSALVSFPVRTAAGAALALALAAPGARAQLARPRTASPDAPKILVVPFQRDRQDSSLSLLIADGARERLRSNHLDQFNPISRADLCRALTESGFPCDVPLDASTVRQLARFINAKYLVEANMIRRPGDSVLVVARLSEAQGTDPQAATASRVEPLQQAGTRTGSDLINRLVDGYDTFEKVTQCRRKLDLHDFAGARRAALDALHDYPNNAGAWVCIARILEAQSATQEEVLAALDSAFVRDTLNTQVMRKLAQKYQGASDTVRLLAMLKRILTIDFRDIDLRISTIRMMAQMGQADSGVVLANQGLVQNPANAELLSVKAIALSASAAQRRAAVDAVPAGPAKDSLQRAIGALWDSAGVSMALVADIDSTKVDSLFLNRITNYFKLAPDTANWVRWVRTSTVKLPAQLDNWYTLSSVQMVKNDTAGALEALRGYRAHIPAGAETSQEQGLRRHYALSRYMRGMLTYGQQPDSAIADANAAVQADSTLRGSAAIIFLQTGLKSYRDSAYAPAIERLQKAKDYFTVAGNQRALVPASFFLALSQFRVGVQFDGQVEASRNCDDARKLPDMWNAAEQNMIAGVAQNREVANQILTAIQQFKQRADAFVHNFCHR
jgi:tetratricopeptide (TPR) repeat protein/TolB-like protein